MKTYKGFDKDLNCRGFQYELGKEYEEEKASCCKSGFHACENPLNVLEYYPPNNSRYCEVKQSGKIDKSNDDSKVASTKIKICEEIGLSGLIKAGVNFILNRVKSDSAATNTGDQSAATNTGDQSAATNTGWQSAATNTGWQSAATNTGRCSVATNTGRCSVATNTGWQSAATNTGDQSAATNTGRYSAATNTGWQSAATNTGDQSAATNTGRCSAATNTGRFSAATNTGWQSAATNTGDQSAATNTGRFSAATVEKGGSVAIATGYKSKAKASFGSAICVCERGEWNGNEYPLIGIKSGIIDGEKLKADTFYTLENGEFVEVN